MKLINSWFVPESETHMTPILERGDAYQLAIRTIAMKHVKSRRTAIDIGGHIGTWGRDLGRQFDVLHAFEPMDEFRLCYQKNVEPYAKGDIILHDCVLGNTIDLVDMELEADNTGHSHVKANSSGSFQVNLLDSFGIENVDFIKVDTEGFEEFVCKGAQGTILRWKPVMVIEQKPHAFYQQIPGYNGQYGAKAYLESLGMIQLDRKNDDFVMGWK